MGTNYVMRNGLIAALGVSGLMLSACAGNHGSRYASIYDYESGGDCGSSCGAPAPLPPVYADCGQVPQMGCVGPAPAPVHMAPPPMQSYAPAPGYSSPPSMSSTYGGSGTISSGTFSSGTSSIGSGSFSSGSSSYGSGSSYSSGVMSSGSSYGSGSISSSAVECPSGTTLQPDNTCIQNGSGSYSSGISAGSGISSGSYTTSTTSSAYVPSTTVSSQPVTCPAGTILQGDNTCMQTSGSSYSSHTSTVTTTAPTTTTHHGGGYTSSGGYTATDYLPIRK